MIDYERLGKTITNFLRHNPGDLGLTPDPMGYFNLKLFTERLSAFINRSISVDDIRECVKRDDKDRFEIIDGKLRAVQGHSFPISLEAYKKLLPPDFLYHGTSEGFLETIFLQGLLPQSRNMVHLTDHIETAKVVAERYQKHGAPRIFLVDSKRMVEDGFTFYRSMNGVWLISDVPATYLQLC